MIDYGYCQSESTWGDVYMNADAVEKTMKGIRDVGGSRVRVGVQVGTYRELDRAVDLATKYGLKPLLCILGNPQLGYQGNPASFGDLCKNLALRYGPSGTNQVAEYELLNESNNAFNPPGSSDPAVFVQYLKSGYTAVKSVHTSSTVISGGAVPAPTTLFNWSINPVDWMKGVYAAGAKNFMDAVGYHLYADEAAPTPAMRQWKYMTDIRQVMLDNADGAKKIWVTEVGTSFPGPGITSQIQARDWLKAMIDGIQSYPYCGPFFVYNFRNSEDKPQDSTSSNYGIVNFDFTPKPLMWEYAKTIRGTPTNPADRTPPTPPTNLKVVDIGPRGGLATYGPGTDDVGVTVYRIYDAKTLAKIAEAGQIGQTAVPLVDLTPASLYGVYATAVDAAGNESLPSNVFSFTTAPPSGPQQAYTYDFADSPSVPTMFTQLGAGFTVAGGAALPVPPTADGEYITVAPYNLDQQSPDHVSEIVQQTASAAPDRVAMAACRISQDGTQWMAAVLSGGGKTDAARIVMRDNGVITVREARNATPLLPGERLRIVPEGNVYTAVRVAAGVSTELVSWTDVNGIYTGSANRRAGIIWRYKRVGGVNYMPPAVASWNAIDLNAVAPASAAAGVEPWMLAIANDDDWAEIISTGLWETTI